MSSVSMQTEKSRRDEYSFRREDEDFGKDDDDDENNIDLNECLEMVQDFIHLYQQTDGCDATDTFNVFGVHRDKVSVE